MTTRGLLVDQHHALDPRWFLAATDRTPAGYSSFLGTKLDDPDAAVLVAERDGDVIGYAYAEVQGYDYMSMRAPAGVLHDVIVEPGSRQRGVGRRLAEAAQRLFASMGFRRTMIEMTRELENAPAWRAGVTPPPP